MKSGSRLEKLLQAGEFVFTGELGPPKSADKENVIAKAEHLKGAVDAVNITDNQTAIVRMSSISAGLIVQDCGLEPVIQITCRDRNRLAIQHGLDTEALVFARQVHGTDILVVTRKDDFRLLSESGTPPVVDALVTNVRNHFLVVQVADCQPVFLYDTARQVIANIHSGWRGSPARRGDRSPVRLPRRGRQRPRSPAPVSREP